MMRNADCKEIRSGAFKRLFMMLAGLVVLVTAGCGPGSGDGTVIAVLPFEGSLKLEADFTNTGETTGGFVFNFGAIGSRPPIAGEDVSAYQSLKFSIDTSAVASFENLTIRLESPGVVTEVNLADYVPRVSRSWKSYDIPLGDFPGLDLANTIFLGFWDARDSLDVLVFGKLDFDDIHFVDAAGATLGVYSETNADSVLTYSEIINGDDPLFSGNTTNTQDSLDGLTLPTDTLLNLRCADVGIYPETCILIDPDNPFATAIIGEFDSNNPDPFQPIGKFILNNAIPAGATGAKARFYLWATALARVPSGENQWYTARALHELWDAQISPQAPNGDPIVQEQALKAYRSVLDNFFNAVTFFDFVLPPSSFQLKELVGADLYCPTSLYTCLFVGGPPNADLAEISQWGYTYVPSIPLMSKNVP